MDANNTSLLHSLDAAGVPHADFKHALQRIQLESVFDVVRMSKEQFIRELGRHSGVDAGRVYEQAQRYATHITRLYQEHQLAHGNAGRPRYSRSPVSDALPMTYQGLFKENREQFCHVGDIAAIDSPVAYLRALHLFAGQLEGASTHPGKITLAARRPDLSTLVIDHQSAFAVQPMLNIVNDILLRHIEPWLAEHHTGQNIHDVLANEHYPFSLPYDLHHQQCLMGLGAGKPTLGALNYTISRALPFSRNGAAYGSVLKPQVEAQKLLSGLSPEQQRILIAPGTAQTREKAYGTSNLKRLRDVTFFMARTGMTIDSLNQLLVRGRHGIRPSVLNPTSAPRYGSAYINGLPADPGLAIEPTDAAATQFRFQHESDDRFDRLQRMIRLQRWTAIPFAELDTLIVNALRSERSQSATLNDNTLRTLGVYRHLERRYGIAPEEFASLLHHMPTQASGERVALFDRVFHTARSQADPAWKNDASPFDIDAPDSTAIVSYLCAGLGLAPEQVLVLTRQTKKYLGVLKRDLPTISSIYRQARIARLFGLSPVACIALANVLGADTYCRVLASGTLSPAKAPATDMLDVLMAMDWAVDWLRHNPRDVAQLSRLFDPDTVDRPMDQALKDRFTLLQKHPRPDEQQQAQWLAALLHDTAALSAPFLPCVMKLAGTSVQALCLQAQAHSGGMMPTLLAKALRVADAFLELHLSSRSLEVLLDNPAWLASASTAALTPHTLYLLERFSHCVRTHAQSEESLVHYLRLANQDTSRQPEEEPAGLLARLLKWNVEEVSVLTRTLPGSRASSMEDVDWIMRCQACCQSTGLSATTLLEATSLATDSQASDWKTIGEAVIAAGH